MSIELKLLLVKATILVWYPVLYAEGLGFRSQTNYNRPILYGLKLSNFLSSNAKLVFNKLISYLNKSNKINISQHR